MADLQNLLSDLVSACAKTKQIHWTIVSQGFLSTHAFLDDIHAFLTKATDDLAERMITIGTIPDGQVGKSAADSDIASAPVRKMSAKDGATVLVDDYTDISNKAAKLAHAYEEDLATQDLLIEIVRELDKLTWLLEAQVENV